MIKFSATITCQFDTPFAPFKVSEYREALDWLKASGFDGAEVCISNYDSLNVQELHKDLSSLDLECSTISTGQSRNLESISLIHKNPESQKKAQQRIIEHIDAASVLGSKVTIGLLRGLGSQEKIQKEQQLLMENLQPCLEYAEKSNITLLIEAINRYETAMLNSAEQTMDFIDRMGGSSSLGILWDVFHANIEDSGFSEAIKLMEKRLRHIHLADSNRYFPGYGHIDFNEIYNTLQSVGYSDYMSFECLNLPYVYTVKEESRNFIQNLKAGKR